MGCDIHLFTEKIKSVNGVDKWVNCDHWKFNPYFGDDEHERELELVSLYDNRNYELFGVLAGVRGNEDPIDQPRGLPIDISPIVRKESDRWGNDGHSHSYLTLAELKEFYNKKPTTPTNGFISIEQSQELDKGESTPNFWNDWSAPDRVYREWDEESPIKIIVNKLDKRMRKEFWVLGDEDVSKFDEMIRIVFWFDN